MKYVRNAILLVLAGGFLVAGMQGMPTIAAETDQLSYPTCLHCAAIDLAFKIDQTPTSIYVGCTG